MANDIKEALIKLDKKNQIFKNVVILFLLIPVLSQLFKIIPGIINNTGVYILLGDSSMILFLLLFIILIKSLGNDYHKAIIKDEYTMEFVKCTNKYKRRSSGKNKSTHYYISAEIEGQDKNSSIPRNAYYNVEVGDTILAVKYGKGKVKLFTEKQLDEA